MVVEELRRIYINLYKESIKRGYTGNLGCSWTSRGEPSGSITLFLNSHGTQKHFRLTYTITRYDGEKKEMDFSVLITSTPCNYGKERYWFICPNTNCKRRCGTLYEYGDYFLCNKCCGYLYDKQTQSRHYKALDSLFRYDLEEKEMKLKKRYYRGKPTRKYQSILNKQENALRYLPQVNKYFKGDSMVEDLKSHKFM